MALSLKYAVLMMFIMSPISSSLTCPSQLMPFLHDLQLQCPATIMYSWPIEINGDLIDKVLSSSQMNGYVAILFYASWCPFSRIVQPKFDALSSMFPQIKHAMVEQASVPPIVFSTHGIHGVPSILIVNSTTRMQHHGPKDLKSLVHFYQKATGLEPLMYLSEDQVSFQENKSRVLESSNKSRMENIVMREPYLTFSIFFLFLKALIYIYPNMVFNLIALWVAYIPHLNLSIFGESRQILVRVLHILDFERVISKLKLIKTRNFHNGARSARLWASSLASFSLGKTSSARPSPGGKL